MKKIQLKESIIINQEPNIYYRFENARLWLLHLVNATNTYELIGLNMVQEVFEMLEKQLAILEIPRITLEDAEKLDNEQQIYIDPIDDEEQLIKNSVKDFQALFFYLSGDKTRCQDVLSTIQNIKNICAITIHFIGIYISRKMLQQISKILRKQFCLRKCHFQFMFSETEEVNSLYESLLKYLPKEMEHLELDLGYTEKLTDSGFQDVVKGISKQQQLKKLKLNTLFTNCSKEHIDMTSDILKEMTNLTSFSFQHKEFTNTEKMEKILEIKLGMKPIANNNGTLTNYAKR